MGAELALQVLPSPACDLDFTWYRLIRDELLRRTVPEGARVLDVGCGPGDVLLMLSGQMGSGVGVDSSEREISAARAARKKRRIKNVEFRVANALKLPFRARSFDTVLCLGDVLSYSNVFGRKDRVLSEIRRVLAPGGLAVHDCMNWEWEYAQAPYWAFFSRPGKGRFRLHRVRRTASGVETGRSYNVVPDGPLQQWLQRQDWPVSPQGDQVSLDVAELRPIPRRCLEFDGVTKNQHCTPARLKRAYAKAGFRDVEVLAYGQTYDIAVKAGVHESLAGSMAALARAEAETILERRAGSGPWLFLLGRK